MNRRTTRRRFLQCTAAGSAAAWAFSIAQDDIIAADRSGSQPSLQPPPAKPRENGPATGSPVLVVTGPVSRDVNSRGPAWLYITEVLRRAGLFFDAIAPSQLGASLPPESRIIILAGNLPLSAAQRDVLAHFVKSGGALIGLGGTSGLDNVFGVNGTRSLSEGWMRVTEPSHPVTTGLRSSLHVFGGQVLTVASGKSLAEVQSGYQGVRGAAIVESRFGEGSTLLVGPDLLFSIVHFQQGLPVFQDAKAPGDEDTRVHDGELKAEDGLVLDWQRDRTAMEPDGAHIFLEPVSDELREIILRSIFHVASQHGLALPVLWYWPKSMKAVGHISHDSDGNDPGRAEALLQVMNECGVKSTWCILYPGGYPKDFYGKLKDQDYEIALHYDARTRNTRTTWSRDNLVFQHEWLMKEAGISHITSNKNHYTRWEGRLDFFRWCESLGIEADQTRGPSKKGTTGFPLGGSQPYFPLDDELETPRFLDVFEVNMLTQDLVVVCPGDYGQPLVDRVLRHHGVAHFLFHPAHIQKPNVADALGGLVEYGRSQGIEWWTSRQIVEWEKARRGVTAVFRGPGKMTLRASTPLRDATLMWLKSPTGPTGVRIGSQSPAVTSSKFHGFEFMATTTNISGTMEIELS